MRWSSNRKKGVALTSLVLLLAIVFAVVVSASADAVDEGSDDSEIEYGATTTTLVVNAGSGGTVSGKLSTAGSLSISSTTSKVTVTDKSGYGITYTTNNNVLTFQYKAGSSGGKGTVTATANSGYTFTGWSSSSGTNGTVTANFTQLYTCNLNFNANGGSGGPSNQTYSGTATTDHSFTIPTTVPSKSGYTFLGWNTSNTATSASYSAGGTIAVGYSSTVTLYAIWSKTISITYNANGGSGAPSAQSTTVYNSTTSATFTISSTVPTKSGYTFLGWNTSNSATSATYSSGQTNVSLSSSKTLYAIWSKTISITYNANGGSGAPSAQSTTVYNSTTSATFTISSTVPTKSGYTFLGWNTSNSATSATYSSGQTNVSLSSSKTLYAIWSKSVTLTYDANGGSGAPSAETKTIYNSASATFTVSSTSPTKTGHTFLGWGTSNTAQTVSYVSGNTITTTANTTIYALWQLNTYQVKYYYGSTLISDYTENIQYNGTIGHTTYSNDSKVFCGWYTDSGLTTYFDPVTKITKAYSLYAYMADPLTFTSSPVADATITYASSLGCVLFDALESQSAARVYWDFGDGTYGNEVVMYHHYEEPGTYNVLLSVFNYNGELDTKEYVIAVYDVENPPEKADNSLLIVGCTAALILASFAIIRPF